MGAHQSSNTIITFRGVVNNITLNDNYGNTIKVTNLPEPFKKLDLLCENVGYSHIIYLLEVGKEFEFKCKLSHLDIKVLILTQLVGHEVFAITSKIVTFSDLSMRYTCKTNKYAISFKKSQKHTIITTPAIKESLNCEDVYFVRYVKHKTDDLYVLLDYVVVDEDNSNDVVYKYDKL